MKTIHCLAAIGLLITQCVFAQPDIKIVGDIQQSLPHAPKPVLRALNAQTTRPTAITLLKVELSNHAWTQLQARVDKKFDF